MKKTYLFIIISTLSCINFCAEQGPGSKTPPLEKQRRNRAKKALAAFRRNSTSTYSATYLPGTTPIDPETDFGFPPLSPLSSSCPQSSILKKGSSSASLRHARSASGFDLSSQSSTTPYDLASVSPTKTDSPAPGFLPSQLPEEPADFSIEILIGAIKAMDLSYQDLRRKLIEAASSLNASLEKTKKDAAESPTPHRRSSAEAACKGRLKDFERELKPLQDKAISIATITTQSNDEIRKCLEATIRSLTKCGRRGSSLDREDEAV